MDRNEYSFSGGMNIRENKYSLTPVLLKNNCCCTKFHLVRIIGDLVIDKESEQLQRKDTFGSSFGYIIIIIK